MTPMLTMEGALVGTIGMMPVFTLDGATHAAIGPKHVGIVREPPPPADQWALDGDRVAKYVFCYDGSWYSGQYVHGNRLGLPISPGQTHEQAMLAFHEFMGGGRKIVEHQETNPHAVGGKSAVGAGQAHHALKPVLARGGVCQVGSGHSVLTCPCECCCLTRGDGEF